MVNPTHEYVYPRMFLQNPWFWGSGDFCSSEIRSVNLSITSQFEKDMNSKYFLVLLEENEIVYRATKRKSKFTVKLNEGEMPPNDSLRMNTMKISHVRKFMSMEDYVSLADSSRYVHNHYKVKECQWLCMCVQGGRATVACLAIYQRCNKRLYFFSFLLIFWGLRSHWKILDFLLMNFWP